MGKEIKDNKIVDPIKMLWKKNHAFVTPPGWWHSHHNESNICARVFPVQDAGLHTYMETLDINFI
jgi:gentisate 1,2-dioxygenase